jgi:hypothetical protein
LAGHAEKDFGRIGNELITDDAREFEGMRSHPSTFNKKGKGTTL